MTTPVTSSGGSGNVFGQQTATADDIKTSAWTEINKAALGIVSDSIEQVFTQMNPRYTQGYLGGFGYKASQDQPLLDHPLESVRYLQTPFGLPDDSWRGSYEQLVNQLPADLLARFQQEARQPFDERSPAFVALDNLLTATAKFLTKVGALSQPEPPDSLPQLRTSLNLLLPFATLNSTAAQGKEITDSAYALLQELGPNYRYFDGLHALIGDMQTNLDAIKGLDEAFAKKGYGGDLPDATRNALGKLAERLDTMHSQLQRSGLGDDLQLLNPMLKAMTIMTAALSLPHTGSASLFLGLSIASIGLKGDSATGLTGNTFHSLTENVTNGILASLMPNANFGERQMLQLGTTVGLAVLVAIASRSVEGGIGVFPEGDTPTETKSAQFFAFELALLLANSSGSLNDTAKILVETSGGDDAAQAAAGPILGQLATLLMIVAATRQGHQPLSHLVEAQRQYLEEGLSAAQQALEEKSDETERNEKASITAVAVKLSQIALEQKEFDAFVDAYSSLLESLDTSLDNLTADIDSLRSTAAQTASHLTGHEGDDQPLTGIQNVV